MAVDYAATVFRQVTAQGNFILVANIPAITAAKSFFKHSIEFL